MVRITWKINIFMSKKGIELHGRYNGMCMCMSFEEQWNTGETMQQKLTKLSISNTETVFTIKYTNFVCMI